MKANLYLILKLAIMAFLCAILYIFLHEGGHALVAVLCGAKITSFSIIGAHTSATGGKSARIDAEQICKPVCSMTKFSPKYK
ncbi:MAG: M50 family metallopeptidase [Eubacterium sp.]|nr:M50 family metallopeptidase [Eubacterium sp.]